VFSNPEIQKIFHGADFDIRSLYRDFGIAVNGLFDTELASRFLGFNETGLDAVLKNKFGIEMDKRFRKKDWSRRPLSPEMIEYAANDVAYLLPLAAVLKRELKAAGRLSWVHEECEALSKVRTLPPSGKEPLFIKFRGAGRLDPKTLAVLEALLQFRSAMAEKKDVPPFKIMSNSAMIKLAKEKPGSLSKIKSSTILSKKQVDMYGGKVAETVNRAARLPESELPRYPRRRAPVLPSSVHKRIKVLKEWRSDVAERLALDPGLFLNKTMLTAIASQRPGDMDTLKNISGLKKWQRRQFGEELMEVLRTIP
jgi:ribonuclease D